MFDLNVSKLEERTQLEPINRFLPAIFRVPTAVEWNRVEGRPRSPDLARPLRAEVRDALWMLARQWQVGEFQGEDAGVPVNAKLSAQLTAVSAIALGSETYEQIQPGTALEALVERQTIEPDLMMGLYVGQRWLASLSAALGPDAALIGAMRNSYALAMPSSGGKDLASLRLTANRSELQLRIALAGKGIDGARLLSDIAQAIDAKQAPSATFAVRGIVIADDAQGAKVDDLATQLLAAWRSKLFAQPALGVSAWKPEHLEYNFSVAVPTTDGTQDVMVADQYAEGHLDWYSFDASAAVQTDPTTSQPASEGRVVSFIPTAVRFPGAPVVRWWEFEDQRVGFGLTSAAKTDLVKLLLAEFGLVFSNDWFIVPFGVKVGSLVETKGIVVTDNFGCNTLVEPTSNRQATLTGNWSMWSLSRRDAPAQVDTRFLLVPALAHSLESKPTDEVLFMRDEMANLVWGIETVVPDATGGGRDARGAAKLLRQAIDQAYPQVETPAQADDVLLRYQLMGSLPENWMPLVSVRLNEDSSNAFLQGAMPRVPPLEPGRDSTNALILEHNAVLPIGSILARDPQAHPNLIYEEEILRDGIVVKRTFQQARWHDGNTFTWCGYKKQSGRGEGSSGLAFDQALPKKGPNGT